MLSSISKVPGLMVNLDNFEEMVREGYSHIQAGESGDVATAAPGMLRFHRNTL